jgi:hypothetical protein
MVRTLDTVVNTGVVFIMFTVIAMYTYSCRLKHGWSGEKHLKANKRT